MKNVLTKGSVVVNEIKVGDIHYEYQYGIGMKVEVVSLPVRNEDGLWSWQSKDRNGNIVDYAVHEDYAHYGPNLYDYEAYTVDKML